MTFILNNITNWLTDSQSSESSSVETDARTSEQCQEWITAADTTSGYTSVKRIAADYTEYSDYETTEDTNDDDLPGISKVVTSAIEWGGYLLTYGKETGRQVTRAAMTQIKSAFEENASREVLAVDRGSADTTPLAPWIGYGDEEVLKVEILSISEDKRNFLRGLPAGVQFHFDYARSYPVALIMLLEDPNLKALRFELVPKQIKEETFWRNYFYRVALIKQSAQLAKHRAQVHESVEKTAAICGDNDLVFVPNTFTACDEEDGSNESGESAAQKKSSNVDLQDFELVEMTDCDDLVAIDMNAKK